MMYYLIGSEAITEKTCSACESGSNLKLPEWECWSESNIVPI
jgi:hypothetical protein